MPRETVLNIKFVDQSWSKMFDQFLLYLDPCWSPLESDQIFSDFGRNPTIIFHIFVTI